MACWIFGPYWVAAYAGVAFFFVVSRSMWVRLQGEGHPAEAAPTLGRLFMMFGAAFGWIVVLTTMMPLTRNEVQSELGELYRPCILIIGTNWLLLRFPRFLFSRQFLPKPGD